MDNSDKGHVLPHVEMAGRTAMGYYIHRTATAQDPHVGQRRLLDINYEHSDYAPWAVTQQQVQIAL